MGQNYTFFFYAKKHYDIKIMFMKIFCKYPTVNISKLNFWLVICIAKNVILTTLKVIFSIFRFFCTLRFQIYKYCPIITNHTSMERLFIQLSDDVYISISKNWPLWLVLCSRLTFLSKYITSQCSKLWIHSGQLIIMFSNLSGTGRNLSLFPNVTSVNIKVASRLV